MKERKIARFYIGQRVKVIDKGKIYTTHSALFKQLGFANHYRNEIGDSKEGRVFAIDFDQLLYGVFMGDGHEILISEDGLNIILKPILVPISKEYTASISDTAITVGCQVIKKEKLLEIIDAAKRMGLI